MTSRPRSFVGPGRRAGEGSTRGPIGGALPDGAFSTIVGSSFDVLGMLTCLFGLSTIVHQLYVLEKSSVFKTLTAKLAKSTQGSQRATALIELENCATASAASSLIFTNFYDQAHNQFLLPSVLISAGDSFTAHRSGRHPFVNSS